jgi:hypothetical protein
MALWLSLGLNVALLVLWVWTENRLGNAKIDAHDAIAQAKATDQVSQELLHQIERKYGKEKAARLAHAMQMAITQRLSAIARGVHA